MNMNIYLSIYKYYKQLIKSIFDIFIFSYTLYIKNVFLMLIVHEHQHIHNVTILNIYHIKYKIYLDLKFNCKYKFYPILKVVE